MRAISTNDIYEYQFNILFKKVQDVIGRATIATESEQKEDEELFGKSSSLLFDISGVDFKRFKVYDSEYRYLVEAAIQKIIENLLDRKKIGYEEKYYGDGNEQHSIVTSIDGYRLEAYFLFDLMYEEATWTDYDKIAAKLKARRDNVDEVHIYIFRDFIGFCDLANMVNGSKEFNENGFLKVFALEEFFNSFFGDDEYPIFLEYAQAFHDKCNSIISYKTVINPTQKTLTAFKKKKAEMLKTLDYQEIANMGMPGELSDSEFEKVSQSFSDKKMYLAMVSSNDFAESFISAEWSYDVYSNAMGDLDLTGIIAGYLKSVEQLLFKITKFHINEGLMINTKDGRKVYDSSNESIIDSTLHSLNQFVTSKKGKLAHDAKIRGCLSTAISQWTKYQRNGYFHKHNLYKDDNKIDEVRLLTIYLYFLILGGLKFSDHEIEELGVINEKDNKEYVFNLSKEYVGFENWLDNVIKYDLPETVSGIKILFLNKESQWFVQPYLMNGFSVKDFMNRKMKSDVELLHFSHVRDIPGFYWKQSSDKMQEGLYQFKIMLNKYVGEHTNISSRIPAILLDSYVGGLQLIMLKKGGTT